MKLYFQKWVLSQFISALVHFYVVGFSLVTHQNLGHKMCGIQQILEKKTTDSGEGDKRGCVRFQCKWCRCGGRTFRRAVLRTPVLYPDGHLSPSSRSVILLAYGMPGALLFLTPSSRWF